MNPARAIITAACNRMIAKGESPIAGTPARSIVIRVKPVGRCDYAEATFAFDEWSTMHPLKRVFAIHDQCRAVLKGERFEVLSERLVP
jgi:hypothetical protein